MHRQPALEECLNTQYTQTGVIIRIIQGGVAACGFLARVSHRTGMPSTPFLHCEHNIYLVHDP